MSDLSESRHRSTITVTLTAREYDAVQATLNEAVERHEPGQPQRRLATWRASRKLAEAWDAVQVPPREVIKWPGNK